MNNKTLLEMIGCLDDSYVLDAAPKELPPARAKGSSARIVAAAAAVLVCLAGTVTVIAARSDKVTKSEPASSTQQNISETFPAAVPAETAASAETSAQETSASEGSSVAKTSAPETSASEGSSIAETVSSSAGTSALPAETLPPASTELQPLPSVDIVETSHDVCLVGWNGKIVSMQLRNKLESCPEDEKLRIRLTPPSAPDFKVGGKTLEEYYNRIYEAQELVLKLTQLLKEGDSLKYGTALYEGGAPGGEKWDRDHYDKRVGFYGEELLAKYIRDGEFLRAQAEADIPSAQAAAETARIEHDKAIAEYCKQLAESLPGEFEVNEKYGYLIAEMTKSELREFDGNGEGWHYCLLPSAPQETAETQVITADVQ